MERQRIRSVVSLVLRRSLRATPWTFAGIATALLLAWGLVMTGAGPGLTDTAFRDRQKFNGEGLGRIVVQRTRHAGYTRFESTVYPTCVSTASGAGGKTPEEAIPEWARDAVLPWLTGTRNWPGSDDSGPTTDSTSVIAAGWPFAAVWGTNHAPIPFGSAPGSRSPARIADLLPSRPIWAGLAADGALFTLIWWGLWLTPRTAIGVVRAVKGRCAACGYDLSGLPASAGMVQCPECGSQAREPARARHPALGRKPAAA